jgi:iron-sulfur cluster assembly accessory protein
MTITEKAAEKAKAILSIEGKDKWGIKIYVAGQGCCGPSYGLNLQEEEMPNDEVVEKNGLKVFIDKQISEALSGMQLDYYAGNDGEGFIFSGGVSSCSTGGSSCGTGSSGCDSCG